ncbi:MAG: hypothetical protein NT161_01035 [Candidatus Nomurabacteria bacterium]|nr:hypothetical protein [Candidatus Nomurabacteria bacterium]
MNEHKIMIIDRSIQDTLYLFKESGWFICEQNEKSLTLNNIDWDKVLTKTVLSGREKEIDGRERLARLKKNGYTLLDIGVAETILKNPKFFPETWKRKTNKGNFIRISFDGTILQNRESGYQCSFFLYWEDGFARINNFFLDTQIPLSTVSAILGD